MNTTPLLKPILLLAGNDSISREKTKHNAIAAVMQNYPNAEIERYDPELYTLSIFVEHMLTTSMFQTVRIFIVRDVHTLKKNDLDTLTGVFAYDLADLFLILETDHSKEGKEKNVTKDFGQWFTSYIKKTTASPEKFSYAEFMQPPDYKTAKWLTQQTPFLVNRNITERDAAYLVELIGSDTATLYSELQKIDVHLPPGEPICHAAIASVTGATRQITQFELAQAVGKKDMVRVLEIIDSLYAVNVYAPLYIVALFKHFWALFKIRHYAATYPDDIRRFAQSTGYDIKNKTGLRIGVATGLLTEKDMKKIYPVMILPNIVQQAMSFTLYQYIVIIGLLKEYDIGIKTGKISDSKIGLQLLCFKMVKAPTFADDTVESV